MEIRLRGPGGRRHVINASREALKERLCSQGEAHKSAAGRGLGEAGGVSRPSLPLAAEIPTLIIVASEPSDYRRFVKENCRVKSTLCNCCRMKVQVCRSMLR